MMVLSVEPAVKLVLWSKSEAKKHLRHLLMHDDNDVIHSKSVKEVHKLSPLFRLYNIKKFGGYLATLKREVSKRKSGNSNSGNSRGWANTKAQKELIRLFENSTDSLIFDMCVQDVHKMSPLFQPYYKAIRRLSQYN